ncbi:hypothetical protein BRM3_10795 [Brachybacterium huguangmaarense]|uniref:Uncharacterized protein n=1 Tax=Brachybacterium huguangmaarense TaxID=1652028 RepID=A0ABY6FZT0_9MICO|nr:hypothetical protein [Brachybacterium huguangmaarense]UYG16106.1 hypothetical protein BRM3_10795 [Brachybacterium huguangmaarense]
MVEQTILAEVLLADPAGALAAVGALGVGGVFLVGGVIVLALTGERRARGAQRRRIGSLTPLPDLLTDLDAVLLRADEAVRAAADEQLYADAEFGASTASTIGAAVEAARTALDDAFSRRQEIDGLLGRGEEIAARSLADEVRTSVTRALTSLRDATTELTGLRREAVLAPERVERARRRCAELTGSIAGAREELDRVAAREGEAATAGLRPALAEVETDLAAASADLDRIAAATAPSSPGAVRVDGTEVERLAAVEASLETSAAVIARAAELSEEVASARAALPGAVDALRTSLVRAEATDDPDPRLPQAVAVARAAVASASAGAVPDPVTTLARVQAARTEVDAAVEAARTRYDADRRAREEERERTRLLSDAYDPRAGQAAEEAARGRYGVLDPAMPRGIAGDARSAGRPAGQGFDLVAEVLDEITRPASRRPRDRGRRRW